MVLGLRKAAVLLGTKSCSFQFGDTVKVGPTGLSDLPSRFPAGTKLYLETIQPAEGAAPEEFESFNDLAKKYEENCKGHKTQLEIAADLVDECEQLGFKKDAYVLDGAFWDKELMGHIDAYGQAWVTRLAKSRLVQVATGGFITVEEFTTKLSVLKHWELTFPAHAFLELGFDVTYLEGMPVPVLETIGHKCRFFEIELLQSLISHIKALVLDKQDTQEVLTALAFKRLNRLAH